MNEQFLIDQIQKVWPASSFESVTTIVALSGGADSVALARLINSLKNANTRVVLAHFNHGLRGEDSNHDQSFCQQLANDLELEFESEQATVKNGKTNQGEGIESLARTARYDFLRRTAKKLGARFVATAHTRDDQTETMLHRLFRGTGLRGLTGIQTSRPLLPGVTLIRPLLNIPKSELTSYLSDIGQLFRTDQSNFSEQFTRNRIRNELIPMGNEIMENDISESLLAFREILVESLTVLEPQINQLISSLVTFESDRVSVRVGNPPQQIPQFLLNEMFIQIWKQREWPRQQMTKDKWDSVSELYFQPEAKKINLPGNLHAQRHEQKLVIWAIAESAKD